MQVENSASLVWMKIKSFLGALVNKNYEILFVAPLYLYVYNTALTKVIDIPSKIRPQKTLSVHPKNLYLSKNSEYYEYLGVQLLSL